MEEIMIFWKPVHFLWIISLLLLSSCGGSDGDGGSDEGANAPQEEQDDTTNTSGVRIIFDQDLTSLERSSSEEALSLIRSINIDGKRIPGFTSIFNGSTSSAVVRYLEQRVNYLISLNTPYESRYIFDARANVPLGNYYAQNQSTILWYTKLINERESGTRVSYDINGTGRDINSSRVGVVKLGDIFSESDAITRAITLVHEARHSDCPGGAWASDLLLFKTSGVVRNFECGQFHGRPDGGDPFAWGPYTIDFIYSAAIAGTCSSCTEAQRQQAQVNANMVSGAASDIAGTLNGDNGSPDMSSSSRVREDL